MTTPSSPDPDAAAASGEEPLPRWWHSQPLGWWWVLPLGLGVAVWMLLDGQLRMFGYVVAGTLGGAALVRLVLPRDLVGGLMIRSRLWDVVIMLALAAAIAGLSYTLNIPVT